MGATVYGKGDYVGQFSIPTKHGLYSNFRINNHNAHEVHAWDDCPIGLPANILVKDLVATSVGVPTWDTDYFD